MYTNHYTSYAQRIYCSHIGRISLKDIYTSHKGLQNGYDFDKTSLPLIALADRVFINDLMLLLRQPEGAGIHNSVIKKASLFYRNKSQYEKAVKNGSKQLLYCL